MALMLTRDEQYIFNLRHGNECPSLARLSHLLGVSRDDIKELAGSAKAKVNAELRRVCAIDTTKRRRHQSRRRTKAIR